MSTNIRDLRGYLLETLMSAFLGRVKSTEGLLSSARRVKVSVLAAQWGGVGAWHPCPHLEQLSPGQEAPAVPLPEQQQVKQLCREAGPRGLSTSSGPGP